VPEDDAVGSHTKKDGSGELVEEFGPGTIEAVIRERIRSMIEMITETELERALGAGPWQRAGEERRGYRHGKRDRTVTTSLGATTFAMPRARVRRADGSEREWQSQTIERYQRRTKRVDEALIGVYLSGTNTRRIRSALSPLLSGAPLSKDAISRLVGRLGEDFRSWQERDLREDNICYLFLDGWYPKVRIGKRRERVPVLVVLGVRRNGERLLLDMRMAGDESQAAWGDVLEKLVARNIGQPELAAIDGNPGLAAALKRTWPSIRLQRCTAHKLRNLLAKAPASLREELSEDYRRTVYGADRAAVEKGRAAFIKRWRSRCPAVAASFEEAGDELFTFLDYPPGQWRSLRTTNALERINEEFRRRTKTQAVLPSQDAVLLLLYGLVASGQIRLRLIDGWQAMPQATEEKKVA
jgi:transposase-like protein